MSFTFLFRAGLALACGTALPSCASIMQGTTQEISISSNPTAATITVDNQPFGDTPAVVDLSRKDTHVIELDLDGYQPYEIALSRGVSGWVWGNVLFGGVIGLAVDAISGGMYKLTPEQVAAEMRPPDSVRIDSEDGLVFITVVLEPDPAWERIASLEGE